MVFNATFNNISAILRQLLENLYWSLIYTYLANKCLSLLRIMSLIPAHEKCTQYYPEMLV
jgi:hypothetical protein